MMKKRLISCLMVLALTCSFLPASVLADEVQEEPTVPVTEEPQPAAEEQGGALEGPTDSEVPEEQPQEPQGEEGGGTQASQPEEEPEKEIAEGTASGAEVPATQEGEGTMVPVTSTHVARIGDTEYETLDEAVAAAGDGDTIELLTDCSSEKGLIIENKTVIIQGDAERMPTVTLREVGMYVASSNLTFENCILDIQVKDNPNHSGATCNLISKSTMTFNHVMLSLTADKEEAEARHGLYIYLQSNLYIKNDSHVTVSGFNKKNASGIYSDESEDQLKPDRYMEVSDHSTLTITDCGWHGMTINPVNLTISDYSIVDISECGHSDGRGGLGCYYGKVTIKDHSQLRTDNNVGKSWGAFVKDLAIDGTSELSSCGNTGVGLDVGGKGEIESGAKVVLNENTGTGLTIYYSEEISKETGEPIVWWNGDLTVSDGADVTIKNNTRGISVQSKAILNMQSGVIQENSGASVGGGIRNYGTVELGDEVALCNNHAVTAGDDIYNAERAAITFGPVGSGWVLDDCGHGIDGWYDDAEGTRWSAHGRPLHTEVYTASEEAVSDVLALKAAHDLIPIEPDDPSAPLEISKSKTTTNLDKSYESRVTLSLPSASYKPSMDVVMVIDVSSSMKDADIQEVKNAAEVLCSQLAEMQNLDVKVGVVTFDKNAHDLTGGLTTAAAAKNAVGQITVSSDTNMMAGLMMGKAMLDEGNGGDKYLVVMSDGIPIYWMEDGEAVSKTLERYTGDRLVSTAPAGSEPEGSWAYSDDKISPINDLLAMKDWETDSNIWRQEANTGADLNPDCKYTNIQKATYQTARYLRDAIFGRYNMKMVAFGTDKYKDNVVYQYGENFCDWIGEQTGVAYYKVAKPGYGGEIGDLSHAFADIADSLVYLVDAGSRIEDYMGYVEGSYDFDFVNDVDKLLVTVNGAALDKTKLDDNTYGFGRREAAVQAAIVDGNCKNYRFVLKYVPGEKGGEHFVFFINEAITKEYPVQLTYTVQLMNPKTASGTYGEFDADGSEKHDGLYTNNSATLYPVDSDGVKGLPESFAKPTVSYTVGGSSGGDGGGGKLNTEDHYSYIIGYKDGYLRPYGNISRGETATIFFRMLTDKTRTEYWSQTNPYTDVAAEKWCSNAISTLHRMGIIDGYSDGTFRPDGPITRAAFTKMAVNFFDYHVKAYDGKFSDVEDSAWYAGYIQAAAELKLIEGFDDGTFRPNDYITRAQACTIINRTLGRVPQGGHMNIKPLVTWPDCDADDWYYTAMMEATNSHDYKWITVNKEKTEEWTAKLPQRDWAALEHTWSTANSAKGGEVVG